ncbi:hypothetical protein AR457_38220 [Streptomyces agglomeratus]|uniref:hypothetical protein n=1 Tax=Streptomyces agglomeratus TaxID=285458 RepID=UPI000854C6AD|nr:hypothetical protein [Streptomyces agglomeratus]OEJ23036.1 hypothetical protein AR457_38220 [Streptomyces agglomeratus]
MGAPAWSWQPAHSQNPGTLAGQLHLGPHIKAQLLLEGSTSSTEHASAVIALIPAHPEACHTAWALAIMLLGTLVTPTYRSTAMPAPDPASLTTTNTDYAAAATTTRQALRLLDDNDDFDQARGSDPLWPTAAEATAVQALRDL